MIDASWLWLLLLLPVVGWLRSWYNTNKYYCVVADSHSLEPTLQIIRSFGGFRDSDSLENGELRVKVILLDPYNNRTSNNDFGYAIFFPKQVLKNANYKRSQLTVEDLFRHVQDNDKG